MIRSANPPLRLAMIGGAAPSMIGPVHRIAALMDRQFDIVAAVPSSHPEKGIATGLEWGLARARIYPGMEQLLAGEHTRGDGAEAVAICTPNDSHYRYAQAALHSGLHVMLDKPMCNSLSDAVALQDLAQSQGCILALAHAYAGYPMLREARARVARGDIGAVRMVQVEYLGSGLAAKVEDFPDARKRWRLDPERSGPSLVLGDTGTHAHHLACYASGLAMTGLSADIGAIVPDRRVHDYAQVRFRMGPEVRGSLLVCQAAAGAENDILVRVFGAGGHVEWRHRDHNHLKIALVDGETRIYGRGQPNLTEAAMRATRIPRGGHPEGLHEAFANLYTDFAALITAKNSGIAADPLADDLPQAAEGVAGLQFVEAALASSHAQGAWINL